MQEEHEFTLVKNQPSYALPADFDRFINGTLWDRVDSRPVTSVSPQVWQESKSGLISADIFKSWRIKANDNAKELFIDPTPTVTQCTFEQRDGVQVKVGLAYEYISKNWALSTASVRQATFSADTDTFILDDELLELSLKWRWLNSLAQSYTEEKAEYLRALSIAKAQDGGASKIQMDGGTDYRYPNIPETGIGL